MKHVGLLLTFCFLCVALLPGCGSSSSDVEDVEATAGTNADIQAFIDDLQSLTTGDQWLELLDDTFVRPGRKNKPEQWTVAFEISTARARLAYANKINEEFGGLNGEPLPTDLGMESLHEALLDAELRNVRPRQAELHYTQDGRSKALHLRSHQKPVS